MAIFGMKGSGKMSMPKIEVESIRRQDAINNIIASIALQEAAVSHILKAEGEKIKTAIAIEGITACELIELDQSVNEVITNLRALEQDFQNKLEFVPSLSQPESEPCPPACKCDKCGQKHCTDKPCLRSYPTVNVRKSHNIKDRWYWRTQNFD